MNPGAKQYERTKEQQRMVTARRIARLAQYAETQNDPTFQGLRAPPWACLTHRWEHVSVSTWFVHWLRPRQWYQGPVRLLVWNRRKTGYEGAFTAVTVWQSWPTARTWLAWNYRHFWRENRRVHHQHTLTLALIKWWIEVPPTPPLTVVFTPVWL